MRCVIAGVICIGVLMAAAARADSVAPSLNPFDAPPAGLGDFIPEPVPNPSQSPSNATRPQTDISVSPPAAGSSKSPPATGVSVSPLATGNHAAGAPRCTIAVITQDIGTDDTFLSRMTFPAPASPASTDREPSCPTEAAAVAARRALDACKQRTTNPYNCVYADTDHVFDLTTDVVDSSSRDSQCISDVSRFIAIACEPGTHQENCSIACGGTADAAADAAREKCRTTHDGDCAQFNAVPVRAP